MDIVYGFEFIDVNFLPFQLNKNIHKYSRVKVCSIVGCTRFTGAGILAI